MKKCLYCGASHDRRSAYCKDSHRTRYNEQKRGEKNPVEKLFKRPVRRPTGKTRTKPYGTPTQPIGDTRVIPAEYETRLVEVKTEYTKGFGLLGGIVGALFSKKGEGVEGFIKGSLGGIAIGVPMDYLSPNYVEETVMVKPERIEEIKKAKQPVIDNSTRQSARQFRQQKIDTITFNRRYRTLLGKPPTDFYMLVHGQSGHGKSYWTIQFAEYFQRNHGNVLFYAAEQRGNNLALQNIMNDIEATFNHEKEPRNLTVKDIINDAKDYDLLVFDSFTEMDLTPDDIKLIRQSGKAAIIGVLQSTKDGNFKGDNTWLHDTDIMVQLVNREANTAQKGRYQSDSPKTINMNLN